MMEENGEPFAFKSLIVKFVDGEKIDLTENENKQYSLLMASGIPLFGILTVTEDDEGNQKTTAEYYRIDELRSISGEISE